ncbi:nucleotide sugar dehydrogenase [Muricoccus aerilatus]|uniref:nucleotide sugar dehydrogenase n=1 Tax=Muricoccus aerilatus TaxID=452982 RepID=UPI0005C14164|nr:nucleotide sugar dehydrogenase [Roseomonas aerilata]
MSGRALAVIGLGYVGLPVAVAFARAGMRVIGFDTDPRRIGELLEGYDRTQEVPPEELRAARLECTGDPAALGGADIFIVTVPTPITATRQPDLRALLRASETVGRALRPGALVVYESTVYPGATEEECLPVLERCSGLRGGTDFAIAYSPERINPGDPEHRLATMMKVVSAQTPSALDEVAALYGRITRAGIHRAPSIRVAEAAKVIENAQRDLNIAFVNEVACIFDRIGIDTRDVLAAASTKWNFLNFEPGLVGGHCIGVDPYYLAHCAERAGHHPEIIVTGRRVNDGMAGLVAKRCVRMLMRRETESRRVTVLGLTFKENVPDLRNSRALDLAREVQGHGLELQLVDPLADPDDVLAATGIQPTDMRDIRPGGAVVLAVAHRAFVNSGWDLVRRCLVNEGGAVLDVKGCLDRSLVPAGVDLWRL